ncbi:clathrin light chain B-like isoform X2 [Pomacea canaliculata]|uniref:clathrin light chain B-like isoform X2 n=1 Tax=Pomacea canaliculata TaxID=400727 RepID=UPI000D739900|nr:clathrin light chain B-like isoform X2 [Pomacea canaliculata]
MSEFEAFDQPENTEEDPAAEFLAREQSELAGLDDFEPSNIAENQDGGFDAFGGGQDAFVDDFGGGGVDFSAEQVNGPSDIYASISQQDSFRAEPEKIRIWREEQKARLQRKDEAEEETKEEWREKAKKELDDWYKKHAEQLEKTRENNRAAEEAFIKDRDEKVPGQAWEKITRLCEFNPKNSKNTKDVSRMRSILLQLKQTPLVR